DVEMVEKFLKFPQNVLNEMGCDGEIDDMLRIKLCKAESNEEIFTYVAWIRAFNIKEPIYAELYHEFYSTYEFNETPKWVCKCGLADYELDEEKKRWSLSALIYYRDLDTTTLRELIDSEGRLPRVGIPRPPRVSMQDLYDRMGSMEIRQEAIERMDVPPQGAYNPPSYAQSQYDQYYQ
ncbi:hypothetical protein Tco_1514602, partial [Tanacetum coccineum]